jgi:hypothetical protein
MTAVRQRDALYYPFHLCHEETLRRLLNEYQSIHFRDYMSLQITPMSGTTAYSDRMGQFFPDLVRSGRIVQGHSVSGPLTSDLAEAIDRDLSDKTWRHCFHEALRHDRRFQHGLFDLSHGIRIGQTLVAGPAAFLSLTEDRRSRQPFSVHRLQELSVPTQDVADGYDYEYALAWVKTSASLWHTIRLAGEHDLEAVTDSPSHYRLLEQSLHRDRLTLTNRLIRREAEV